MEGDEEIYLCEKPSKIYPKRAKHGKSGRCGATLQKNIEADVYSRKGKRVGEAVVLKHYSTTDDWDSAKLKSHCDRNLPDGGMGHYGRREARRERERGSRSRSIIADPWTERNSEGVVYSLNKRNRWNLPEMLKDEIKEHMHEDLGVDVVMIERSIARSLGFTAKSIKPDVTNLSSTAIGSRQVDEGKRKKQKKRNKGRTPYSYSTDLLGMSQERPENEENAEPVAPVKPQVTYEICTPRATHKFPNYYPDKFNGHDLRGVQRKGRKKKHRENGNPTIHEITWSDEEDAEASESIQVARGDQKFKIDSLMKTPEKKQVTKATKASRRSEEKLKRKQDGEQKTEDLEQSYIVVPWPANNNEDDPVTDDNQQSLAAEISLQAVLASDRERSIRIQISASSFRKMEQKFNDLTSSIYRHGWTVYRSQCHPPNYAMKMNRPADELWMKRCPEVFLTCERCDDVADDVNKCEVLVKTVIVSEEDEIRGLEAKWAQSIRQERSNFGEEAQPVLNVKRLLELANRTFCHLAEESAPLVFRTSDPEDSCHHQAHTQFYKERVKGKALELSGFKFETVRNRGILFSDRLEILAQPEMEMGDFCGICFVALKDDDCSTGNALKPCKHWFCSDCWLQHASYSDTRGALYPFRCPAADCSETIDDVTLMTLLPGDVIAKHRRLQNERNVAKSRDSFVCPNCKTTLKMNCVRSGGNKQGNDVTPIPLQCSCGAKWCSHCFNAPHWPATCKANEAYLEEKHRYYLLRSSTLIKAVHGQRCPSCRMPIEKIGGCNMVMCSCGHYFCWKCLKAASECQYMRCKFSSVDLEQWDLEEPKMEFVSMAAVAIETCKTFEQASARRERFNASRQTLGKMRRNDEEETSLFRIMEQAIVYCDAVRCILQHMQVQIGFGHPMKAVQIRKLAKIAKSIQSILVCAERHLFNQQSKVVDVDGFKSKLNKFQTAIGLEFGKLFRLVH